MRTCTKCHIAKPSESFASYGKGAICKDCANAYARKWRSRHLERVRVESRNRYHAQDPDLKTALNWRYHLKKKFGITPDDYDEMLARQDGKCAICGRTDNATRGHNGSKKLRRMAIDHDHTTGRIRGILCSRCNIVLGWIENKELFTRMTAYLNQIPN